MKITLANIVVEIENYLKNVNSIALPPSSTDVLSFIDSLKRDPLRSGPYPKVSLFEASNRILSDVTILFGIKRLLLDGAVGEYKLPFVEYEVALGVEGGNDISANIDGQTLVGEAFNVAYDYFQRKKAEAIKKLKSQTADFRLLIFNAEAVNNPDHYIEQSEPSVMLYLPVNIWEERLHTNY